MHLGFVRPLLGIGCLALTAVADAQSTAKRGPRPRVIKLVRNVSMGYLLTKGAPLPAIGSVLAAPANPIPPVGRPTEHPLTMLWANEPDQQKTPSVQFPVLKKWLPSDGSPGAPTPEELAVYPFLRHNRARKQWQGATSETLSPMTQHSVKSP